MTLALVNSLKSCGKTKDLHQGYRLHADIASTGLLANNTYIGNTLVSMYAKCGGLARAQQTLEELPGRNVISWTALIAGYCQHGHGQKALDCFRQMQSEGLSPNAMTYACVLKACGIVKELDTGKALHYEISSHGLLENDIVLGNALVDMYAKCGELSKAKRVFDELPTLDVASWNALISGYTQEGRGKEALRCFRRMRGDGFSPDAITYALILKACGSMREADIGKIIHDEIASQGLLRKNVMVGNALVDMYARCGLLKKAQEVLEELPVRDVVSWSALIAGHAEQGQGEKAIACYQQMQSEGLSPDAITYACILKACGLTKEVDMGKRVHDEIVNQGLLKDNMVLGNALVDMYGKCGELAKAQEVLYDLPVRDVVSWSALIVQYFRQGQDKEALICFQRMLSDGVSPDASTYSYILRACGNMKEAEKGQKIHDHILSQGLLEKNVMLGNALVDMYSRCGVLTRAEHVLDKLPVRTIATWNALIGGYVQQGREDEALSCFQCLQSEGLSPDAITLTCILKACGNMQQTEMGKKIHDEILEQGLLKEDIVLGNALTDMYSRCGELAKAQEVLDELPIQDIAAWNTLISGHIQRGHGEEAMRCFQRMQSKGLSPDPTTYTCILKACGIVQNIDMGQKLYDEIVSQGLLEKNIVLGNTLVDMYAKCGVLSKAQKVLDELLVRDVVSWNALIAGYAEHGQGREALDCFLQMRREGIAPDTITYACILKACGMKVEADMGDITSDEIVKQCLLEKNVGVVDAPADRHGALIKTRKAVEGNGEEELVNSHGMLSEGIFVDAITYTCILKACGAMQEVNMGKQIHDEITSQGLLGKSVMLDTALVSMYAKCAALTRAQQVLDELPVRNVVTWNALVAGYTQEGHSKDALDGFQQMQIEGLSPNVVSWSALIGGYAQQGMAEEALDCFHCMQEEGIVPDGVTLLSVLNACSHSGLVDEGQMYFGNMSKDYGITPNKEHHTCMVDLLGRAKDFETAFTVINVMPFTDYPPVWSTLLGACREWRNVKLGRLAFEHALQLDGHNAGTYVSMANVYAASTSGEDAQLYQMHDSDESFLEAAMA